MLYGSRVILKRIVIDSRDDLGRAASAFMEVEGRGSRFAKDPPGYVFTSFKEPLVDGELYTLDLCPNDWYGYFCARVIKPLGEQVEAGFEEGNVLYHRIANPGADAQMCWPDAAVEGQFRFMQGMEAMHQAGAVHDFEPSKREYIGSHGADPILLVQGPTGTGKRHRPGCKGKKEGITDFRSLEDFGSLFGQGGDQSSMASLISSELPFSSGAYMA